ncbi:hypothetical protein GCM10011374_02500 [Kocuria dechangensis]|uniref:DUF1097 domain-containing protein n=1 Tax=Kocuria dechangensis TaxID=1176249 RepID=A0A917GFB0_9MICC|nr:hypothetical protein [Kocuria dechangensis]GGG43651.1 hypothetical protein GCM10011374_02500 [Kocuria dechangensis]
MSVQTKGMLIQAALGAVLITVLMLPFQALTPFAPYTGLLILPVLLFFALQAPPRALLGMFLSFAAGVGWAGLFMLVAGALPGVPLAALLGAGVTVVIFLILSVHPILLGRTPFGVVPAVLLGFVESLLWLMLDPVLGEGAPRLNPLWLIGIFGYGCLMTLVLLLVQDRVLTAVLGNEWRSAPSEDAPTSQIPPTPPTRAARTAHRPAEEPASRHAGETASGA